MNNKKYEILINYNKKPKVQSVEYYIQAQDLKIWDSTRMYDSDRNSQATDMGTLARVHGIGTPKMYSG
jgi:hypothetical protein